MRSIFVELFAFILIEVTIIFCFAFYVSWKVAQLSVKVEQIKKDLDGLGNAMRFNHRSQTRSFIRLQLKWNDIISELGLNSSLREPASPKDLDEI